MMEFCASLIFFFSLSLVFKYQNLSDSIDRNYLAPFYDCPFFIHPMNFQSSFRRFRVQSEFMKHSRQKSKPKYWMFVKDNFIYSFHFFSPVQMICCPGQRRHTIRTFSYR